MQIITPINIDLINVSPLPIINLKQGDTGRGILVTITANGNVCEFTTETVNIYIKKPDGTLIYNACTIQDGKIKAMFTNQALAAPGKIPVELEVISESDRLSTPIAIANILPSNIDSDAIESSNEFTALTQALQQVTESTTAANQAAQAANTAAGAANSAASAANEAAGSVTEAKKAAESAASAANTAAGSANTAADAAVLAAGQANTAAGNANSAAQAANEAATNANNAVASIGDVNDLETTDKSNLVAAINELNDDLGALGNVRLNASGSNGDVRINGYTNLQLYLISVNVGGKYFQVPHLGNTGQSISHYVVYGNGNLTYFWFEVQADGTVRFVQSWSTNGGWISNPDYTFAVYQVMGIQGK